MELSKNMDMSLLSSMLPNVVSTIGGLWQQEREQNWAANEAQKNRDFQARQAAQLNDWNRENWRMQNEYNTPDAMLQRYRAAGISDAQALQMMGQGSTQAGQIQSSVAAQGSQATAPGSAVNAVSNSLNSAAVNAANVRNLMATAEGQEIDNKYKPIRNEKDIELLENKILEAFSISDKNSADAEQVRQMLPLLKGQTRAEMSAIYMGIQKASQELQNLIREGNILDIEALNKLVERGVLQADIYEKLTAAGLNIEQAATQESVRASNYASANASNAAASESLSRIPVNNATAMEIWTNVVDNCIDLSWKEAGFRPDAKGVAAWTSYFGAKKKKAGEDGGMFDMSKGEKWLSFASDLIVEAVSQSLNGGVFNPGNAFPSVGQHGAAYKNGFGIPDFTFNPYGDNSVDSLYTPWTFNPLFR